LKVEYQKFFSEKSKEERYLIKFKSGKVNDCLGYGYRSLDSAHKVFLGWIHHLEYYNNFPKYKVKVDARNKARANQRG